MVKLIYMKRKIILGALVLFIIVGLAGCKKDGSGTSSSRKFILGRWQVTKVESTNTSISGVIQPTTTTNYTSADYIEFKDNEADEVNFKLGSNQTSGTFVILDNNKFNISLPSKLLYCTTDNISETSFQFTGTSDQSGSKVTETYYLTR
jgi:hypothetical protein